MSEKKVILVTGGNRGIGKEIVRQLAAMGHTVLLGSRDPQKGEAAARGLQGEVIPLGIDMTDSGQIRALADRLAREYGHLDAVINNAGVMSPSSGPATQPVEEVRSVLATNFFGIYELSQALLPLLRKSEEGRIVNLSSQMGERVNLSGSYAGYRLSKYLLNGYTIMLADELRGSKVKVNAMCPGWVKTDMGGANAHRTVEKGAETAVWLVTADEVPNGKFFRDLKEIEW